MWGCVCILIYLDVDTNECVCMELKWVYEIRWGDGTAEWSGSTNFSGIFVMGFVGKEKEKDRYFLF